MKSIKLKEILFKDDIKYNKETNMYSQIISGKGIVKDKIIYYPHWENACYYTWKNDKMIYRLGETIYEYTEKDNAYPDFIFRSKGHNDLIFDYPWDYNGKDEYIQGNRWNYCY